MRNIVDRLIGWRRLTVEETQRLLVLRDGRFEAILGPGQHRLKARGLKVEWRDLANSVFASEFSDALERARPDLFSEHLTVIEGAEGEVTVITRRGRLEDVLRRPWSRKVFWTDAGPWEVKRFPVTETLEPPKALRRRYEAGEMDRMVMRAGVRDGATGLPFIDGDLMGRLKAGVDLFWNICRKEVSVIDRRWRELEVTGREVLTADRLTLRVNLTAGYRVVDPVRAATTPKDFA
ncbi:MAG: hypothetical protein AAF360_02365 [Pseudomonadota bacterium]